jgi:hypothetical protein
MNERGADVQARQGADNLLQCDLLDAHGSALAEVLCSMSMCCERPVPMSSQRPVLPHSWLLIKFLTQSPCTQFNPNYKAYVLHTDGGPSENVKRKKFRGKKPKKKIAFSVIEVGGLRGRKNTEMSGHAIGGGLKIYLQAMGVDTLCFVVSIK